MTSLYKTPESKEAILQIYQDKLDELQIDYTFQQVATAFGTTNIILTGDPANPPLVLIHGSNGCAPIALEVYPNLAQNYRVYAVDVIAQPNRSSETRPSMKDNSYGKWMNEVLAVLDLEEITLVGFSFGGFVIWKTLLEDESRIKEAFLTAPVGIVNGNPLKMIFSVFIPMKRYMKKPKLKYLQQFIGNLFSERDDFAFRFLSKVITHFEMDFSPIPTIKAAEAKRITTPMTIIAAKYDLVAPGEKLLKRGKKIFPSLQHQLLLENSKHVQSEVDNRRIEAVIMEN